MVHVHYAVTEVGTDILDITYDSGVRNTCIVTGGLVLQKCQRWPALRFFISPCLLFRRSAVRAAGFFWLLLYAELFRPSVDAPSWAAYSASLPLTTRCTTLGNRPPISPGSLACLCWMWSFGSPLQGVGSPPRDCGPHFSVSLGATCSVPTYSLLESNWYAHYTRNTDGYNTFAGITTIMEDFLNCRLNNFFFFFFLEDANRLKFKEEVHC